ncbi:MAG TPA: fluoride efflux transporter CrcB [Acidimicrobiia bacterium]
MPGARGVTAETPAARSPFSARLATRRPHHRVDLLLAVGVGGAVGTLVRYEVGVLVPTPTGGFPWATFIVNVAGAFILGLVTTLALERWPPTRYVRPIVGIGFCGGLTTFSTWMVEATQLVDAHHTGTAIIFVVATTTVGLAALIVGVVAARSSTRSLR